MISLLCYFGALNFSCVRPRAQKARKRQKMSSWQILGQYGPDIKILPFFGPEQTVTGKNMCLEILFTQQILLLT